MNFLLFLHQNWVRCTACGLDTRVCQLRYDRACTDGEIRQGFTIASPYLHFNTKTKVIISSFGLVINLCVSPYVLQESTTWRDWVSVFLIISGISLAITAIESSGRFLLFCFNFKAVNLILPQRTTPI